MNTVAPVSEEERFARIALSLVGEPGDPRLTDLVHELGAVTVWGSLRDQGVSGGLREDLAARIATTRPDAVLETAMRRGLRFVVPGDPEWAPGLDDLALAPALHARGGVPVGLWVRGEARLDEVSRAAVAVVGCRSATTYGTDTASSIAAFLAHAGHPTVSGAAIGIDQAAHRGSLMGEGPTIAVLACGADRSYPQQHRSLLDHITTQGLVVSESPPGGAPTRIRFLSRNRLIAALGHGTLVVEAGTRSGSKNTASWAERLGRPVMGVPGPVTSETSTGVHQLIRERGAVLVTSGEEVLEVIAPIGEHSLETSQAPPQARDALTARERQILDAVPRMQAAATTAVARTAGVSRRETDLALRSLHRAGLVEHSLGRWRLTPG